MSIPCRVEFWDDKSFTVVSIDPPHKERWPLVSMNFKACPAVGHIIEAPNRHLRYPHYRVAMVYHTIHGDIIIKVIPA